MKSKLYPLKYTAFLGLLAWAHQGQGDLVAHWTFDADSYRDGVYQDHSGNARVAMVTGEVASVAGGSPLAESVIMDGSNRGYLTTPYFSDLSGPGKSFSLAAWVKVDTGGPSGTYPIFTDWASKETIGLLFWMNPKDGRLRFQIRNQAGKPVFRGDKSENASTTPVSDDAWTHIAVVWAAGDNEGARAGKVSYYINGKSAGSMASQVPVLNTGAFLRDNSELPGRTYGIGIKQDKGEVFKGGLDDLRVYSHALSEEEIKTLQSGKNAQARN